MSRGRSAEGVTGALLAVALVLGCASRGQPATGARGGADAEERVALPGGGARARQAGARGGAAGAGAADGAIPKLPLGTAPKAGPLRVEGYPTAIAAGTSAPASPIGFTRDGAQLVYCLFDQCCMEDASWCALVDASGEERRLLSPALWALARRPARAEQCSVEELRAFTRAEGLVELPRREAKLLPPKASGTWAFGGDITLVVREIAPTAAPDGTVTVPGSVRIGGRLAGSPEVFVLSPPLPDVCERTPMVCMQAHLQGVALSPDASELGFVVFVRNPSHGSSFSHLRIAANDLAARVLGDTGMLHHRRAAYREAAELFTRAAYAAPAAPRFAYALACALARLGDPRAEHALRRAIDVGGDAVRARARHDEDLAGVRAAAWFAALVESR